MAAPEKILKKIVMILLGCLLVIYVSKQLSSLVNSTLETETALMVTVQEKVETDAYIMRDEMILNATAPGIMLASVGEGERVSSGQETVRIYSRENDVSVETLVRDIDNKIDVMEKSTIDTTYASADLTKMDEEISDMLISAAVFSAENDLMGAISKKDDILIMMNKRWLVSNPSKSFSEQVQSLSLEKVSLKNKLSGTVNVIYSSIPGYYFSDTDGYEEIFSSKKIADLDIKKFKTLIDSKPEVYSSNVAGKIVTDYLWYVACPVSYSESTYFTVGKMYNLEFPYGYSKPINMKLEKIITDAEIKEAVLVFSSGYMPEDFEYKRVQKVNVVYKEYSGLKVPDKAVRVVNDLKGVYVMKGTEVEFKLISEIYSLDDSYIVEDDTDNYPAVLKRTETYSVVNKDGTEEIQERKIYYQALSLYDQIILGGRELYDGMRIE